MVHAELRDPMEDDTGMTTHFPQTISDEDALRITSIAYNANITAEELDEAVHELASLLPTMVNNEGRVAQLQFLMAFRHPDAVVDDLHEIINNRTKE